MKIKSTFKNKKQKRTLKNKFYTLQMLSRQIRYEKSIFSSFLNLILHSIKELQYLMNWGNLFFTEHALKLV